MVDKERRRNFKPISPGLLPQLNEARQLTLASLEKIRLGLRFVRHPMFLPVVCDPDHRNFAILVEDGALNEAPAIKLRD